MFSKMIPLNLPAIAIKLKEEDGKTYILDSLRKKYLLLTPEEWVRQHIIHYLIHEKKYPKGLIKLETGLYLNTLQKRADVLISNSEGLPFMVVECKAPEIKINQKVFDQIARYNYIYKAKYLFVTNGINHFCAEIDHSNHSFQFINEIPNYKLSQ